MYNFDFPHIIGNVTAIKCNYNGEVWFLFPYALLSLSSPFTINYIYNLHKKKVIIITILSYILLFISVKFLYEILIDNIILKTIILQYYYYIILLFYFTLGILLYKLLECNIQSPQSIYYIFPLIGLMVIKSMFKITIVDGIYAFVFILIFLKLPLHPYIKNTLIKLGHRSMPIWLTHTFFCVYLFSDFIYGFKYPIIIFIALVIMTYLSAIPIMYIAQFIIKITKI